MATVKPRSWTGADGKLHKAWRVSYTDAQGKRHKPQFATKREADEFRDKAVGEVRSGTHTPDSQSITLEKAGESWLKQRELDGIEETSLASYRSRFNLHLKPRAIASEKLSRITRPMVVALKKELQTDLSAAMARKVMTTLKMIMNHAIDEGTVAVNVAGTVKFRKPPRPEPVVIPTKEDLEKLIGGSALLPDDLRLYATLPPAKERTELAQAGKSRLMEAIAAEARPRKRALLIQIARTHAMVVTAIWTGLRASEARGLRWDNVNFSTKTITVVERADIFGKIGAPKSKTSVRNIPMSPLVLAALTEWRKICPSGQDNLVFPNPDGKNASHTNFVKREWYELQEALGWVMPSGRFRQTLKKIDGGVTVAEEVLNKDGKRIEILETRYNWHTLRHAFASLCCEMGFPPKKIQGLMGHATISITMDLYSHLWPSEDDDHARFEKAQTAVIANAAA